MRGNFVVLCDRKVDWGEIIEGGVVREGLDSKWVCKTNWWEIDLHKEVERFNIFHLQIKGCTYLFYTVTIIKERLVPRQTSFTIPVDGPFTWVE